MTLITFTDTIGAATLLNAYPAPASRFSSWTPMTRPFGDKVSRLSDGAITMFRYRTDYGASFELPGIPVKHPVTSVNYVAVADRLIAHLLNGGTCSVTVGDTPGSVYATCGLWPDASPELRMTDRQLFEWTLSCQLINLEASPAQMNAVYA